MNPIIISKLSILNRSIMCQLDGNLLQTSQSLVTMAAVVRSCMATETHLVANHQDYDEDEHRGHYYASDDDDHRPAQELGLHKVTLHVLRLGGELHTAHHSRGRQGGDDVIIDRQDAEVVRRPRSQVVDQEVLA